MIQIGCTRVRADRRRNEPIIPNVRLKTPSHSCQIKLTHAVDATQCFLIKWSFACAFCSQTANVKKQQRRKKLREKRKCKDKTAKTKQRKWLVSREIFQKFPNDFQAYFPQILVIMSFLRTHACVCCALCVNILCFLDSETHSTKNSPRNVYNIKIKCAYLREFEAGRWDGDGRTHTHTSSPHAQHRARCVSGTHSTRSWLETGRLKVKFYIANVLGDRTVRAGGAFCANLICVILLFLLSYKTHIAHSTRSTVELVHICCEEYQRRLKNEPERSKPKPCKYVLSALVLALSHLPHSHQRYADMENSERINLWPI